MIWNLLLATATTVMCLAIQSVFIHGLLLVLVRLDRRQGPRLAAVPVLASFGAALFVLLAGNLVQSAIWAVVFVACGEFPGFAPAFYHSLVNFTTLGYGDVVMSEEHRLLGALEALNGVLMLGLSSGVLFTLLGRIMRDDWRRLREEEAARPAPEDR